MPELSLLYVAELTGDGIYQAFKCGDVRSVAVGGELHVARHRLAVEYDSTAAACSLIAAALGRCEPRPVAQRLPWRTLATQLTYKVIVTAPICIPLSFADRQRCLMPESYVSVMPAAYCLIICTLPRSFRDANQPGCSGIRAVLTHTWQPCIEVRHSVYSNATSILVGSFSPVCALK